MLTEYDGGLRTDPGKVNIADHLRTWLKHKPDLEQGTREKYDQIVEHHLVPALGSLTLATLRPDTIRATYMRWVVSGRRNGSGGLSPATIRKIHTVLRQALQSALDDGTVSRNVAAGLRLPKGELRKKRALDEAEVGALLKAANRPSLRAALILMIATGLRRGELLGLTWPDIDMKAATLCVRRSVEKTNAGLRLKKPKTNRSRVVAIPSIAIEAIRVHRIAQNEERLRSGDAWTDLELVFPGLLGELCDPAVFSQAFRRAAVRAEIGSIGPHALRHTAATNMLVLGIHPKVAADRLGHSSTRMTLDVYSHVVPALESDAAGKVDGALRKIIGQHPSAFGQIPAATENKENAAISCGVRLCDGGHERSRTSDPYSVNLRSGDLRLIFHAEGRRLVSSISPYLSAVR
jgi:integrase